MRRLSILALFGLLLAGCGHKYAFVSVEETNGVATQIGPFVDHATCESYRLQNFETTTGQKDSHDESWQVKEPPSYPGGMALPCFEM